MMGKIRGQTSELQKILPETFKAPIWTDQTSISVSPSHPVISKPQSPGQRGGCDKPQEMLRLSIAACTHAIMRMINYLSAS